MKKKIGAYLLSPFSTADGTNKFLIGLFILINSIVLFNAVFHHPKIGYDAPDYIEYIDVLSKGRLPSQVETEEFFSPPLAFAAPAAFLRLLRSVSGHPFIYPPNDYWIANQLQAHFTYGFKDFSLGLAAKFAQGLNVLYSLGITFFLLKTAELVRPGDGRFKFWTLAFLGMLPVYYKTMAMVRSEPLLAFLVLLAAYHTLKLSRKGEVTLGDSLLLGVAFGLIALTRQWGLLTLPAMALFLGIALLKVRAGWGKTVGVIAGIAAISVLVCGWFYYSLYRTNGSFLAFNRPAEERAGPGNQPLEFYFGLGLDSLFRDPVRDNFGNQLLPIFYSETWGDYWSYFTIYAWDEEAGEFEGGFEAEGASGASSLETNRFEGGAYLGRVNLVALLPTTIFLAGFVISLGRTFLFLRSKNVITGNALSALGTFLVLASLGGYLWFLVNYTHSEPDTIKASYMLQIFPFASLMAADGLEKIGERPKTKLLKYLLGLAALHNIPLYFTHYIHW